MNIFVTHKSPVLCARNLDNRRLKQSIRDMAQLLSTVHHIAGGSRSKALMEPANRTHPCTIWVRESSGNYRWTFRYFAALCTEFQSREGQTHELWRVYKNILDRVPKKVPEGARTDFVNCSDYPDLDVIEGYRKTLKDKWASDKNAPKWGDRTDPPF